MPATTAISLTARMNALKEASNHSVRSNVHTSTPLKTFLLLYTKASHECYIDRMAGAQALFDYLSPIALPHYRAIEDNYTVPALLRSYDMKELASILANCPSYVSFEDRMEAEQRMERAILIVMFKEVLPEIY